MTFSELLKSFRLKKRLTQAELASKAGVAHSYINALESGKRNPPVREKVLAIARALSLNRGERDGFLLSAGYAPETQENWMGPAFRSLSRILGNPDIPDKETVEAIVVSFLGWLESALMRGTLEVGILGAKYTPDEAETGVKFGLTNATVGVERLKLEAGDHVLFIYYNTKIYHDILLDIFAQGMKNRELNESCVFVLTDELGDRGSEDAFRQELTERGIDLQEYPSDKYKIVFWEDLRKSGDVNENSCLETAYTRIASAHLKTLTPKVYNCIRVIAEITSRTMLLLRDPQSVLEYEEDFKGIYEREVFASYNPLRIDDPAHFPMTTICVYSIEHLQHIAGKGISPFRQTIEKLLDYHDKIVALTKEGELLTDLAAEQYIKQTMPNFAPEEAGKQI